MPVTTLLSTPAKRVSNFNAGPGPLPLAVLEIIREELLDYRGTGMSVMEMSHRSAEYEEIQTAAEQKMRRLMHIPDEYAVIFVQGGGSMQFSMVPMNLCLPNQPVEVINTGTWTAKAIAELKKGFPYHVAASTEAEKFTRVPRANEIHIDQNASYVHIATNNTRTEAVRLADKRRSSAKVGRGNVFKSANARIKSDDHAANTMIATTGVRKRGCTSASA